MKVGDLVRRKKRCAELEAYGKEFGIVIEKKISGRNPEHPCVRVLYPENGRFYDMAESLMEVVSESDRIKM